jgi:hypothetical protein
MARSPGSWAQPLSFQRAELCLWKYLTRLMEFPGSQCLSQCRYQRVMELPWCQAGVAPVFGVRVWPLPGAWCRADLP